MFQCYKQPPIGVAFCTKGKAYLFDVIDTTGVPHTAENLYDICEAQIKKCEEELEIKITCLVTDNVSNMMKMRKFVSDNTTLMAYTWMSASSIKFAC